MVNIEYIHYLSCLFLVSDRTMDMEIQQVPWWNRRSRLERRFFVMSITLLCATVGLAIGCSERNSRAQFLCKAKDGSSKRISNRHPTHVCLTLEGGSVGRLKGRHDAIFSHAQGCQIPEFTTSVCASRLGGWKGGIV